MNAEAQASSKTVTQEAFQKFQQARIEQSEANARKLDGWKGLGGYYHDRLKHVYRFLVTPGQKILELGCGQGDLLAALAPSYGVGVDFASFIINRAKLRNPEL